MAGLEAWKLIGACAMSAAAVVGCSTQPPVRSEQRSATPTSTTRNPETTTSEAPSPSTTSTSTTTTTTTTLPDLAVNEAVAAFGSETLLDDIVALSLAPGVSCNSFAAAPEFVDTDTDWRGIESFSLDVRDRNINSLQPSAPAFSNSLAQVDVVNIGGLATDFSWTPSTPSASDFGFPPAAVDQLGDALDGLAFGPYEYSVGTLGGYSGITNPEVVRADLVDFFERIAAVDPALSEAGTAELELLSDEAVAEISGGRIGVFHLFDDAFLTTRPEGFESLIPNLFGGEPLPAVGAVGIANVRDDGGCVLLEFRLTADSASIDAVLGELAEDPLVDPAELPTGDIVIESLVQAQFDAARQRIVRAVSRNTATIDLDSNVDISVITLAG